MTEKIDHQKVQDYSLQYAEALMGNFFTSEKTFILGNEILSFSEVKQVNFFILKSLFVNWQLEMKRLKSPYFDYDHPEAKAAMEDFMNTISRYIKVQQKDMMPILISAVQETIYLLISPFEFFHADFSQHNTSHIELSFLENELKYIKINKPLMQQLIAEVKASYGDSSPQEEVINILEGILTMQTIMEAPEPYFEKFSSLVPLKKEDLLIEQKIRVPETSTETSSSVEPEIKELVSETLVEPSDDLDTKPAAEIFVKPSPLEEKPAVKENKSFQEPLVAKAKAVPEAIEKPLKEEKVVSADPVQETKEEKVESNEISSLEKDLGISQLEDAEPEKTPGSLNDNFSSPETVLNDTLKKKDPEPPLAEVLESQADPDTLLNTMSINHGYMFINELFDSNADEFNLAMERIETCKDFDSAVELLVQKYARPYKWDMNSKEVKELLKVTFRRFR